MLHIRSTGHSSCLSFEMMPALKLIFLLCLYLQCYCSAVAAVVRNTDDVTKTDCSYKDGRFGRIDLSHVGLKHGVPAFRHVVKDDFAYS
jgi:hypothetical protein